MDSRRMVNTIPNDVLEKILSHRPHLKALVDNLRKTEDHRLARLLEKRLADAYLSGVTRLSPLETYYLSQCCCGWGYGGSAYEMEQN